MPELWIVEYNWKRKQFHTEYLRRRIEENISEVVHNGMPENPDWLLVGICEEGKQFEYIEAFRQMIERKNRRRPNPGMNPTRGISGSDNS